MYWIMTVLDRVLSRIISLGEKILKVIVDGGIGHSSLGGSFFEFSAF